jgi:hypothetical protein
VAKGVACVRCHGRVDQMSLTARRATLDMQWCLACHRDAPHQIGRPEDVFRMDDVRPLSDAEVHQLQRLLQIQGRARLTDCSTCHR